MCNKLCVIELLNGFEVKKLYCVSCVKQFETRDLNNDIMKQLWI